MKRQINFWFICRFTMLCIILEERRKMRKKILDAALLFAFALCLIVTSNIQEEAANQQGGILHQEAPIDISNIAYSLKGKETKIGYDFKDGKKVRVAKATGEVID